MTVLFYGKLASALGPRLDVPVSSPCNVAGLRRHLIAAYPHAAQALQDQRVRAVVGDSVVGDDYSLGMQDKVEFLAPVSGG
jgi:molybdopterin converting factor small subunit